MTKEELSRSLASHALWLAGAPRGVQANLLGRDIRGANLRYANLAGENLAGANLIGADLFLANLFYANLAGANMRGAELRRVNLQEANLAGADLRDANLECASLAGANLHEANLTGANLAGANLIGANLHGATLPDYLVLPSTGSFVAYKRVEGAVLTLYVPYDAMRTSCLQSRKCRVSKAKVIASTGKGEEWRSMYDADFVYRLGEWVEPDDYDDDIRHECTYGIHVFATLAEAEDY